MNNFSKVINNIVEKKSQERHDKAMDKRLKTVRSQLQISEPVNPVQATWNNNKKIAEMTKWKRIETDNKRLLKKIGTIMASPHDDGKLMIKESSF
jgi:hypothetical protein